MIPTRQRQKIFLTEDLNGEIVAHAIARIEYNEKNETYGYFSTIFVEQNFRGKWIADGLILHVEAWLRQMKMPKIIYNTAENHTKLIRLFSRHGFAITYRNSENEMVQLTKLL